MTTQYATRTFQLWLFRVGHGELLVRSPRDQVNSRNVDLVFVGVDYLDIPKILSGVVVSAASPDDIRRAEERLGRPVDRSTIRVLETQGRRHLVIAAYFNVEENDLDPGEVPFDSTSAMDSGSGFAWPSAATTGSSASPAAKGAGG